MQHLKPASWWPSRTAGSTTVFLILSRWAFFVCQRTLHRTFAEVPPAGSIDVPVESGFVALIDFIEPRRADAVMRIGKGLEIDSYMAFTRTNPSVNTVSASRRKS